MTNNENRYNWYEEDFAAFLLSLDLPAYRKDMPIKKSLETEKESFVTKFNEMLTKNRFRGFSNRFYNDLSVQLPLIKKNFDALCQIIDYYDNADMSSAQKRFDILMQQLKDYLFINNIYWPKYPTSFYRVRVSKNEELKKAKDLFHIPYNKRHLVSNERYSMAGHPCLYLASFLQIAWQECGYPHQFYYSEFQYQYSASPEDDWKFITFLPPREIAITWFVAKNNQETFYKDLAIRYLLSYPLVYACSIVNLNGHSAFKQEFVIPQMLMQWVFRNYENIKGIKYFSCYAADDIRHYNGFNVVLPARVKDKRKLYSEDLCKKFKVSNPRLMKIRLGEDNASIVHVHKEKLLKEMQDCFYEANDCLRAMYDVTDVLDKAIRNIDNSNMQLIISIVRNVTVSGSLILEKYNKSDIINKGRLAVTYAKRTEMKIASFSKIYDDFKTNVIQIAESFLLIIDRIPSVCTEDFYEIGG